MSVDRNAADSNRLRRNAQRTRAGDATNSVKITAPLTLASGAITLNLSSTGGIQVSSSQLALKLVDTSLVLAAGGLGVHLADTSLSISAGLKTNLKTNSGLQVSSGLGLQLSDTSLALAAGGVSVLRDPAGAISVSASGIAAAVDGTTMQITADKLAVKTIGAGQLGIVTTKGDLLGFDTTPDRIPVGSNGNILTADSTQTLGLKWAPPAAPTLPLTTKGDILGYDTAANRVPVGANGTVPMADSTAALGVSYQKFSRTRLAGGLGTAVTNTIVNTSFGQNVVIPANTMVAGRTYRLKANLHYSALNTSQRVEVDVWLDSKTLGGTGIAVTTAAAGNIWIEIDWHIVTTGVGGTFTQGGLAVADSATGPLFILLGTSAVTSAIDTTVAHTIDITGLWTVASASNILNLGTITIEEIAG